MKTIRFKGDSVLRRRLYTPESYQLDQLHLESDGVILNGGLGQVIQPYLAGSEVGITFDSLGTLLRETVPIVPIYFNDHIVMRKVEVNKIRAKGLVSLKSVAPQRQCPGNKVFERRRLRHSIALFGAVSASPYPWLVALDLEGLATDSAGHLYTSLSPLQKTRLGAEPLHPTPNLVGHPVDRLPTTGAGHYDACTTPFTVTGGGAVRTSIGSPTSTRNTRRPTGEGCFASSASPLFHSKAIISQWRLFRKRILQRRRDPAVFDDRLNFETVLAFRKPGENGGYTRKEER